MPCTGSANLPVDFPLTSWLIVGILGLESGDDMTDCDLDFQPRRHINGFALCKLKATFKEGDSSSTYQKALETYNCLKPYYRVVFIVGHRLGYHAIYVFD